MKKQELIKLIKECHEEILKEGMDVKYLEIKFNHVKAQLDFILKLINREDIESAKEYLQDQITDLKGILARL